MTAAHSSPTPSLQAGRLAELTITVLERTAMVLADPHEPDGSGAPLSRSARIRYSGPNSGQVVLSASDGFLIELASSLLGVERDEVNLNEQGEDAIKELANIVGGSVVMELGGEWCTYSLGLPSVMGGDQAPLPPTAVECWVESEGELLRVAWIPEAATNTAAAA